MAKPCYLALAFADIGVSFTASIPSPRGYLEVWDSKLRGKEKMTSSGHDLHSNLQRRSLDSRNDNVSARTDLFEQTEILVVDDASTDNTIALSAQLEITESTWNLTDKGWDLSVTGIDVCSYRQGKFIKPLFQDDILYPPSVRIRCIA